MTVLHCFSKARILDSEHCPLNKKGKLSSTNYENSKPDGKHRSVPSCRVSQVVHIVSEIRERIFGLLYAQNETVLFEFLSRSRQHSMVELDSKQAFLPTDPYLCLNSTVVDPIVTAKVTHVY